MNAIEDFQTTQFSNYLNRKMMNEHEQIEEQKKKIEWLNS